MRRGGGFIVISINHTRTLNIHLLARMRTEDGCDRSCGWLLLWEGHGDGVCGTHAAVSDAATMHAARPSTATSYHVA